MLENSKPPNSGQQDFTATTDEGKSSNSQATSSLSPSVANNKLLNSNLQLGKKGFVTEWILLGISLFVLGSFIAFWLVSGKQATLQREYSRLNSQAKLIHSSLERQIKALHFAHLNIKEEVLDGLATATDRSEFIKKRLDAFTEILPLAKNIKLVDINQQLTISSHNAAQELSAEEIQLFNQLTQKPVTSAFYLTQVTATSSTTKSTPYIYLVNQLATRRRVLWFDYYSAIYRTYSRTVSQCLLC